MWARYEGAHSAGVLAFSLFQGSRIERSFWLNRVLAGAAPGKPFSLNIYDILANKSRAKCEEYLLQFQLLTSGCLGRSA
jgi:hypothetical protein